MTGAWALLVALTLVAGSPTAQPALGRRAQVPPERAVRMEAMLARAYPGATLDWDQEQLVYADGRRVPFTFDFYREAPRGGTIFAIASHAPDERARQAVRRLQAFQTPAEGGPRCRLSLMRAAADGTVLGYRETGVDVGDVVSTCDRVSFEYAYESAGLLPPELTGTAPPVWPLVLVTVTTLHALPDAWVMIMWAAVLDTERLAWVSRLPVFLQGARRDGRRAVFSIRNDRGTGAGGVWLFSGYDERPDQPRWELRAPCEAQGCKVEPRDILDAAMRGPGWR